jgi:hypothetical protein
MIETNKEASRLRVVECPKCKARFSFRRPRKPRFDAEGFESYVLDCNSCRVLLTVIIDPYDGLSIRPEYQL